MSIATKEEIDLLIDLQEIETEVYRIRKFLDGVESEVSTREKKRRDVENELNKLESDLEIVRNQYKEFDDEVKDREARMQKSEEHLKNVKTNTEYQTLLREIDDNKKRNSETESQMIDYLEQIEAKEKEVKEVKGRYDEIVTVTVREIEELKSGTINERKELDVVLEKRDAVAKNIKPRLLDRFNKILEQSSGLAIVPVSNTTCGGCFMNIPPQKFIEVQRGESLNFCPQCHRMLYYKEK